MKYESGYNGPYRSRRGVIFGVCRGLADYFDFSVFWMRIFFVGGFVFTGFWPVGILYIAMGLLMKPAPVVPFASEEDAEFYHSYTSSRTMALNRLKRTFDNLDRRVQRMEDVVTTRAYDWEKRLNGG
ncbi:MAG: envelope stress response membrane protein PspC [Candidatus Hydrogenedentes bacterium]|nr:envelope stress response membrane protein PspC [Candidatus Hydrogenedentota bacterium]